MPRERRIKPADVGTYYHLMNRVAGEEGEYPFGDVEKATFVNLLKEAVNYFTVEILAYQVMGNHWHMVCYAPADVLSPAAVAVRYNRFHAGRKPVLTADDPYCGRVAEAMRDVGCFTGWIEQRFTSWFNRTRSRRRRGTLWADRFKSTILERDTALWECLCYVEMNAVRAGIVDDPAEYRFGSWGEWCGTGRHPFGENLLCRLNAYEGSRARAAALHDLHRRFRVDLARRKAARAATSTADIEEAMATAAQEPGFVLRLDRRVRYWSDGLVIGGRRFVLEMAARCYGEDRASRHRLQRAAREDTGTDLWAYRRLRALPV